MKSYTVKTNISSISDSDLIQMLNEIYDWKKNGLINQEGLFKKMYNNIKYEMFNIKYFENIILWETHKRFENIVKVLITDKPEFYIK